MNIGINLAITGTIVVGTSPTVTLGALTLSASSVAEDAAIGTLVGAVQGQTAGSTLSLQDDAGGLFALDGLDVEVAGALDFETATSHNITIRETLAGATNSPNDTVLAITVTDVEEGPSLGPELVTNGGFDADTDWTKMMATISGGKLNLLGETNDDNTSATQNITHPGGGALTFRVSYTLSNMSGTGFRVVWDQLGEVRVANGSYSEDLIVDAPSPTPVLLQLLGVYPTDVQVDDVSVRQVL